MRIAPSLLAALAALAFPAAALAVPPTNDAYLRSDPVGTSPFQVTVDTSEATTQTDTYNPNADGVPFSGGTSENVTCNGVSFGKTVWYDLAPQAFGAFDISAAASTFAPVVALYEYNAQNPRTMRLIDCVTNPGDHIQASVGAGRSYTIQLGGANDTGGLVTLHADYFPDQDADDEFDALDKCPTVAGTQDGCPPELKARAALTFDRVGTGARIASLYVDRVPKGAKVAVKCAGCGSQKVTAKKTGRVNLSKFAGKTIANGRSVEIRVTMGKTGTGTYRFGAVGAYTKYTYANGKLKRQDRCLNAKTGKPEKCS